MLGYLMNFFPYNDLKAFLKWHTYEFHQYKYNQVQNNVLGGVCLFSNLIEDIKNGNFLSFKKMISMDLVKIIYLIGTICITLWGISSMLTAFSNSSYHGILGWAVIQFFLGLIIVTIGNLLWRVTCEGWIIIFGIHGSLVEIEKSNQEILNQIREKINI